MRTLAAFDGQQRAKAKHLLATQVSLMMGRKYEEDDWANVYETVKAIPRSSWSNLSIDVMHGNLGVEQKMLCRPVDRSILTDCGLDLMHPAGTRAIRIPDIEDPTLAARNILAQYGKLIALRTSVVEILHLFSHGRCKRGEALRHLVEGLKFGRPSAEKLVPLQPLPIGASDALPDMRFGWLLWKSSLDEFLYFEERMVAPDPERFRAEWHASGGGRRLASRNLWVYDEATGRKVYSITTSAGAKIQPYFRVPPPNDPNLYHFVVQGEPVQKGVRQVWLQPATAKKLRQQVTELSPEGIDLLLSRIDLDNLKINPEAHFLTTQEAVPVLINEKSYLLIREKFDAVSDEHAVQLLLDLID